VEVPAKAISALPLVKEIAPIRACRYVVVSQTALILVFVLLTALRVVVTRRLTASVLNKDERIQWFGLNRTLGQMSLAFWVVWLAVWWLFNPWEGAFPVQMFRYRRNPAAGLALGGHVFATMPFWRKPRVFAGKSWADN
jgi:hypothetical protein